MPSKTSNIIFKNRNKIEKVFYINVTIKKPLPDKKINGTNIFSQKFLII